MTLHFSDDEVLSQISEHTALMRMGHWLRNIRYNEKTYGFADSLEPLKGSKEGQKCLVLGAGPGFKRFGMSDLKDALRQKPVVVACDGAMPLLNEIGFAPDYVCFTPETLVTTEEGVSEIENIRPGQRVLADDGRFYPVNAVIRRPYKGKILRMKLRGCNSYIGVTPEHPFLVRGHKTLSKRWVAASELKHDDPRDRNKNGLRSSRTIYPVTRQIIEPPKILFRRPVVTSNGLTFTHAVVEEELAVTPDIARIFGYYVAEGSSKHSVLFHFGSHDVAPIQDTISTLQDFFKLDRAPTTNCRAEMHSVTVNGRPSMRDIFDQFGHGAGNKRVPVWLMQAPPEIQSEFVRGYFLGDGNIHPDSFRAVTVSRTLAFQLRDMLLRLGIASSINRREGGTRSIQGKTSICKPSWDIRISGSSLDRMSKVMHIEHPFLIKRKKSHKIGGVLLTGSDGYGGRRFYNLLTHVRDIREEEYDGVVYNLSVDERNTYTLAIGAIVHNCSVDSHPVVANFYRRSHDILSRGKTTALLSTTIHRDVVDECKASGAPVRWFQGWLEDDGRPWYRREVTGVNCGGNIGTTCFVIAAFVLGCSPVGLMGLEFAWSDDTPYCQSQYWKQLIRLTGRNVESAEALFVKVRNPRDGKMYYADPVYYSYRTAFRELWTKAPPEVKRKTYLLTKQGILSARGLKYIEMDKWLKL